MYLIKLYIEDGEKVILDYPTLEKVTEIAKQMKENNEVFTVLRVEKDNTCTEIKI